MFNHYWFGWLATVIPGAGVTAVVGKTIVQHCFCNPVLYLPLFYVFNGVATGLSQAQIFDKAKAEYWPTLTKLWTIWVPSTALQFFLGARWLSNLEMRTRSTLHVGIELRAALTTGNWTTIAVPTVDGTVPTRLQVLYVAGVSFGWNVLLSVSYNARQFNASFATSSGSGEKR